MDDGLNVVGVLRSHLVDLERTLMFVEGLLVAHDLQAEYRNMAPVIKPSRISVNVQQQRERVRGYLQESDGEREDHPGG